MLSLNDSESAPRLFRFELRRLRAVALVSLAPLLAVAVAGTLRARSVEAAPLAVVAGEVLDIKAAKLDVDIGAGHAVLEGSVQATLGELVVTSPKVEIRYDTAPRVRWARGSGGVTATLRGIQAHADAVVLDVGRRSVELEGGVRLSRGKGWVHAERAKIDLSTRKVTLHEVEGSIPVEPAAR